MMIELVGGPLCGTTLRVGHPPSVVMRIHRTGDGQSWEAYYAPVGITMNDRTTYRYDYTEQRKILRPAVPPVSPGQG